jgi:hypothetical protein
MPYLLYFTQLGSVTNNHCKVGLSFLRGQTSYGDSVEDEWLIVYIMLELSKQYTSAWIRITDTDGEFLLIEAANVLPSWLNPEVGGFRVSSSK